MVSVDGLRFVGYEAVMTVATRLDVDGYSTVFHDEMQ